MKTMFKLLAGALLASSMTGCVIAVGTGADEMRSDWQKTEAKNRQTINELALGQSMADVKLKLGEPNFVEAFQGKDGEYRVLFYRTHRTHGDGDTTRDETTPLVFRNGALSGIGSESYQRAVIN